MLTSRYTMDARNPAARREIAALADLVGRGAAARRRAPARGRHPVVTDLLMLRRREHDRPARRPLGAGQADQPGRRAGASERVFPGSPGGCPGHAGAASGAYHADELTVSPDGDTTAAFSAAGQHRKRGPPPGLTFSPATTTPRPCGTSRAVPASGRLPRALPDGTFTEVADGTAGPSRSRRARAPSFGAARPARHRRPLLEAEAGSPDDTPRLNSCAATSASGTTRTCARTGQSTGSRRRTGRTDQATGEQGPPGSPRPRAGSALTRSPPLVWPWRSSTRLASMPPRPLLEQGFRGLPSPVAFVRAGGFFENFLFGLQAAQGGSVPVFYNPTNRKSTMVAAEDIGAEVATLLTAPAWSGHRIIELGSMVSADEVAAQLGEVLALDVKAFAIPRAGWAEAFQQFGILKGHTGPAEEMFESVNAGWMDLGITGTEHVAGTTSARDVFAAAQNAVKA